MPGTKVRSTSKSSVRGSRRPATELRSPAASSGRARGSAALAPYECCAARSVDRLPWGIYVRCSAEVGGLTDNGSLPKACSRELDRALPGARYRPRLVRGFDFSRVVPARAGGDLQAGMAPGRAGRADSAHRKVLH